MRSIPNAIELPQAAAQFLRNFRTRLDRRLRTPPPPARKLIEIFAIRAIAPNRQPCALRQSGQQAQVRRTQCQPQLALPLQPVCQRKPFVLRTFAGDGLVAQVGQRHCRDWNGKLGRLRGAAGAKIASLRPPRSNPPPAPAITGCLSAATDRPAPARSSARSATVSAENSRTCPRRARWHVQHWPAPCRTKWAGSGARCRASDKSHARIPHQELGAILERVPGAWNRQPFVRCCGSAALALGARLSGQGSAESRQGSSTQPSPAPRPTPADSIICAFFFCWPGRPASKPTQIISLAPRSQMLIHDHEGTLDDRIQRKPHTPEKRKPERGTAD